MCIVCVLRRVFPKDGSALGSHAGSDDAEICSPTRRSLRDATNVFLHLQESAFQSSPSSIIGVNALSARKASLLLKRHSSTSMTYLSALNLQVHFYLWLRGGCSLLRTCFRPEHFSGLPTIRSSGFPPRNAPNSIRRP